MRSLTRLLCRHAAMLALLALVAPPFWMFTVHAGFSTMGDDGASYLTLAGYLAAKAIPGLEQLVRHHTHFPPLFPAVLAIAGGVDDLARARACVASSALAALPVLYAYALGRLGGRVPALCLVAVFIFTPSAWLSALGILSEPMFLLISLSAIVFHQRRLECSPLPWRAGDLLTLGILLSAACLTRMAGVFLVAAYALTAFRRSAGGPAKNRAALLIPVALPCASILAWRTWRPEPDSEAYGNVLGGIVKSWQENAAGELAVGINQLRLGWVASFTANPDVPAIPMTLLLAAGALAIAGVVRGVRSNRIDACYAALVLPFLLTWSFSADEMRRLLFPVLPVLLLHAGEALVHAAGRIPARTARVSLIVMVVTIPALLALPAMLLLFQKAQDTAPFFSGGRYAPAVMRHYYTTINVQHARAIAARDASVLHGLELLGRTPPESRVMWLRPEYVAVLGHRRAEPLLSEWDERGLAQAILATGTTHIIRSVVVKNDMNHVAPKPDAHQAFLRAFARFGRTVYTVANPITGEDEFELIGVDRERLSAAMRSDGTVFARPDP